MRVDEDRLRDIVEAIDAILAKAGGTRARFDADELVRVWCLHHLTIIGEASARLSEELRRQTPQIPWRQIIGMRNVVVHAYFDVDWESVWNVVERELVPLREKVGALLKVAKS